MRFRAVLIGWALVSAPSVARAQGSLPPPSVTTAATAEVRRPPNYAVVQVGITAVESTAAEATAQVGTIQLALLSQLAKLGFPADSLPTTRYSVARQRASEADSALGFEARTSMRVVVTDLNRVGAVVDAAVMAGANDIPAIEFEIDDPRSARDEALRAAIAEATHEAEVIALAAGGRLGELLEVSTGRLYRSYGGRGFSVDQSIPVAITPDDVVITASVSLRWRFVPRSE